jgi:hypothetical protein
MRRFHRPVLAVALVMVAGCDDESDAGAFTVRDSAGVQIAENAGFPAPGAGGWSVDPVPSLVIGEEEGGEAYQLYQVRGATRLPDGRIAIVNAGTQQVRLYTDDGRIDAQFGGQGDGPGEFRQPMLAGLLADTLVIYDSALRRVTMLHPRAGAARDFVVGEEGGGFPIAQGVFADGTVAFGGGMSFSSQTGFPSGRIRPASSYHAVSVTGAKVAEFGEYPGAEMFAQVSDGGFSARSIPFGRITVSATGDSLFFIGKADSYELLAFGRDGGLRRIIRVSAAPRPVTAALRSAHIEEALEAADGANAQAELRRLFDAMPFPEVLPPYAAARADARGHLWVADAEVPGEPTVLWSVIDEAGRAVARVELPAGLRLLEIGTAEVLAWSRTELGVEQVGVYALRRPARG